MRGYDFARRHSGRPPEDSATASTARPRLYSATLSRATGNALFLKLENMNDTGSFKERGALNRILTVTDEERSRGVITASAGNHGQAVAYHAARHRNSRANLHAGCSRRW